IMLLLPTISTLFPYTTLFRSIHRTHGKFTEISSDYCFSFVIRQLSFVISPKLPFPSNTSPKFRTLEHLNEVHQKYISCPGSADRSEERRVGKGCIFRLLVCY